MRRALLGAAVAIPLVVLAAINAPSGAVVETTNFNSAVPTSYINAAQCAGNASSNPLNLEWSIVTGTGVTFTGGGTYNLFASDAQPAAVTNTPSNLVFCAEQPSTTPTQINAGSVGSVTADLAVKDLAISGHDVVTAATVAKSCDATQESRVIWICAHWVDSGGTKNGSATGKFIIQLAAPPAPTGVTVGSGDSRLIVDWTASTGGSTTADHYIARATPVGGGTAYYSDRTNSTTATINGLVNGTTYDVVVIAFSIGGNPSPDSAPAQGIPQPSANFWDVYKDRGGAEQGGCASGPAGAFALLGTASLLALRRRKS